MAHRRILSFKYAGEGIWTAFMEEPNLKIHIIVAILVYLAGLLLNISKSDWIVLILTIGIVLSLELTNTAIEAVVDSFTQDSHPGAKKAKDVSAAAVLIASIMAIVVGLLVFYPYINLYFGKV